MAMTKKEKIAEAALLDKQAKERMAKKVTITVDGESFSPDDFLTIAACSKRLEIERQSVQYYITGRGQLSNRLKSIKIAGTLLVAEKWLTEWESRRGGLTAQQAKVVIEEREQMRRQIEKLEAKLAEREKQ